MSDPRFAPLSDKHKHGLCDGCSQYHRNLVDRGPRDGWLCITCERALKPPSPDPCEAEILEGARAMVIEQWDPTDPEDTERAIYGDNSANMDFTELARACLTAALKVRTGK